MKIAASVLSWVGGVITIISEIIWAVDLSKSWFTVLMIFLIIFQIIILIVREENVAEGKKLP